MTGNDTQLYHEARVRHFSCTQCGMCCNRSPEVGLSETLDLSCDFIFRLMFRLYWLPTNVADFRSEDDDRSGRGAQFAQTKRLLNTFAARKYPEKQVIGGKRVAHTKYLLVSALTLDVSRGQCSALQGKRCGIYERRPSSCRSVPFHYSHAEALAEKKLDEFLRSDGYLCDSSQSADVVLRDGEIVAAEFKDARAKAAAATIHYRSWAEAIVKNMPAGRSSGSALPSLDEVETNARWGVTTTSMRAGWRIAAEIGVIDDIRYRHLVTSQLDLIDLELGRRRCDDETVQTLMDMRSEYAQALTQGANPHSSIKR